ncbi:MAG: hypothetical protein LW808_002435 [Verrucomicrobiota bacterium]|nr:MAG: hypothetical protein LW808_002435 [Verrucomicrobiota bacterium]
MDKKGITKILTGMLFLSPLVSEAWKYSTYVEELRGKWKFTKNVKDWSDNPIDEGKEEKDVYEGSRSVVISKPNTFAIFADIDGKFKNDHQMWLAETSNEDGAQGKGVIKNGNSKTVSNGTRFTYYKHPTIYISKGNPKDCSMEAAFYDRIPTIKSGEQNVSVLFELKALKDGKGSQSVKIPTAPLFFPLSTKGKVGDVPMSKQIFDAATKKTFEDRAKEPCLDFSNTPIIHIDLGLGKATYNGEEIDAQRFMEFYMLPAEVSKWYFHPAMALHRAGLLQEEFSPVEYTFSISNDMTPDGIKTWPSSVDGMKGLVIDDTLTSINCKAWALSKVSCAGNEVMTVASAPRTKYFKDGTEAETDQLVGVEIQPDGDILRAAVFYKMGGTTKAFTAIYGFLPYDPAMAMIQKMCTGALPDGGKKFTELETYSEEMKAVAQILNELKDDHGGALPANFENVITAMDNLSSIDVLALKAWDDIAKLSADDMLSAHEKYLKLKPENHGLDVFVRAAVEKPTGIKWDDNWTYAGHKKTVEDEVDKKLGSTTGTKPQAHNYVQFRLAINDLKRDKADTNALKIAAKKLADLLGVKRPTDGVLTKAEIEAEEEKLREDFEALDGKTKGTEFWNAYDAMNIKKGAPAKDVEVAINKFLNENNCNKALTDQLNAWLECYKAGEAINTQINAVPDDVSKLTKPSDAQKALEDAQKKFDALKALLEKGGGKFEKKPAGGGGGGENGTAILAKLPGDNEAKKDLDAFLGMPENGKLKDAIAEIDALAIKADTLPMALIKTLDDANKIDNSVFRAQLCAYVELLKTVRKYNETNTPKNLAEVKKALTTFQETKVWTPAEITAKTDAIKAAAKKLREEHAAFDKAIKESIEAKPVKKINDYTSDDKLQQKLSAYGAYVNYMNLAEGEDWDTFFSDAVPPPPPPPPPPGKGPRKDTKQAHIESAQQNLTELTKLLNSAEHHDEPTPPGVWTWKEIDANTNKFKADFQKFCDKLGEGDFKNAVTEINGLPWNDITKGKERNDKINEILGKSGDLKTLLEKYVACKEEACKIPMPHLPEEPKEKTQQQKDIEAAQENLKALAAHFKIDLGGGDDGGHHDPTPPGMTAEKAKEEIANVENALKAAFGNDVAWENIANGTTINWTAGDAAVAAAISTQPANLQPKLNAYYEYHKLMQEVLNDKISGSEREAKLKDLQGKVEGWKAILSKKDEEHHEDDAALLTGACGPETWTKEKIAKGIVDLTKALGDILSANSDLKGVGDSIDWKKDDLSKKIEEVADETLRSKLEAYVVTQLWLGLAQSNGERKIQIPSDTDPKVKKDTAIYLAQRNLGVAQIGLQKLRELLGETKVVTTLNGSQESARDEFLKFAKEYSKKITLLNLPETVSEGEKEVFSKEIKRSKLRISALRILAGAMSDKNYDKLSGTWATGMVLKQEIEEFFVAARMAYQLTQEQKDTLKPFAEKEKQAEDGIAQLQTEVQKWNDEGKPKVDITIQSKIIADNEKQLGIVYETLYNGFDYDDLLAKVKEYSEAQEKALQEATAIFNEKKSQFADIPSELQTQFTDCTNKCSALSSKHSELESKIKAISVDGIEGAFLETINKSKTDASEALAQYNAALQAANALLGKPGKDITQEDLDNAKAKLEEAEIKLNSIPALLQQAEEAKHNAEAEKEEAEKVQKTIAALKQCEQALLEGLGKLKNSAQKRSKTAVVNALSVAELCVQLHELLWSDTTKTVSKVVAQAEFEAKVQAIENARKGISNTFGDDTFSGGTQSPTPTHSGGYESGNPSFDPSKHPGGWIPNRRRRSQSPSSRNEAYGSSSSDSKSRVLPHGVGKGSSQRERSRAARIRAIWGK